MSFLKKLTEDIEGLKAQFGDDKDKKKDSAEQSHQQSEQQYGRPQQGGNGFRQSCDKSLC